MRVPQVSERIKEVPAQALRGVFAGIGQLLLITDKLMNKAPADAEVPRSRTPEPPAPADTAPANVTRPDAAAADAATGPAAAPIAPRPQRPGDLDKTGNVRLLSEAGDSELPGARPDDGTAPGNGPENGGPPGQAAPPLPGYDALSVASLRARLRNLDIAQVRRLAEYERAHAGRPEVTGMFERRIAKLQAEADARAEAEARAGIAAEVRDEAGAEAEGDG